MGIKLNNVTMTNCGIGFRLEGDVDLDVNGLKAEGIGTFLIAHKHAPMMNQLGLPADTDPKHLARLLDELRRVDVSERQAVVQRSGLLDAMLKKGQDITNVANGIAALASTPAVQALIAHLSN